MCYIDGVRRAGCNGEAKYHVTTPREDARFGRLLKLLDEKLRTDRDWLLDLVRFVTLRRQRVETLPRPLP